MYVCNGGADMEKEIEEKWQQIEEGLKELEELKRLHRIEQRKDFWFRIFHPIKWKEKHKDDPKWIKFSRANLGIKFVNL